MTFETALWIQWTSSGKTILVHDSQTTPLLGSLLCTFSRKWTLLLINNNKSISIGQNLLQRDSSKCMHATRIHRRPHTSIHMHIYIYIYIVGDRLKPRNSVFPVLRKTKNCFKKSVWIETYPVFNTCTIVSTCICCYDFSWRKRVSYEFFLLKHEDTCFLSLTPDP